MPHQSKTIDKLMSTIKDLNDENAMLKRKILTIPLGDCVKVPEAFTELFQTAQKTVHEYFQDLKLDPTKGTIEINDQRYVLVRASALSTDFLDTICNLYSERGDAEAMSIGKNFLFDIAHVIGMNDARNFHNKMNLTDPIAKLSAGPIHFAYSGWAFVDILPESNPTPDENFMLIYNHPYSFEADSWQRSGKTAKTPMCVMNAGYSSGWCEASFGIPLTAVEVTCVAKGDPTCTFIMAQPHKINERIISYQSTHEFKENRTYEIPTFFERKRVEEEMRHAKQLAEESAYSKSLFVANMSHELRTPLGAILGFTDLLKKTTLTPIQKDYFNSIKTAGNSLLSIINDILDLSKMDAGKFIIEQVPFSIGELMHSINIMFTNKSKQKHLVFSCQLDTDIHHYLIGDPLRLTQILINLIGNALKFTEKGSIVVRCSIHSEDAEKVELQFSIKDTGIGIPPSKIQSIFDRFIQADTNITRKYGGTGLGLAISKQLIELQGGWIKVLSEEKSGTEFIFNLTYLKSNSIHSQLGVIDHLKAAEITSGKRILIVEDNPMNQKLAAIILQNNKFETHVADNGKKAIEYLKENQVDLILMDIQMPEMDGYQATQEIRQHLLVSCPIIAMTAHAMAGEKERCIQLGMNDYLSKPYQEGDLMDKISYWLT